MLEKYPDVSPELKYANSDIIFFKIDDKEHKFRIKVVNFKINITNNFQELGFGETMFKQYGNLTQEIELKFYFLGIENDMLGRKFFADWSFGDLIGNDLSRNVYKDFILIHLNESSAIVSKKQLIHCRVISTEISHENLNFIYHLSVDRLINII